MLESVISATAGILIRAISETGYAGIAFLMVLWCMGLAYSGGRLGEAWNSDPTLKAIFHRFDVAIVAASAFVVWHRLRPRKAPVDAR